MKQPLTPEQKAHRATYLKAWRAANPERVRAQERRYREAHPERIKAHNERTRERFGPGYWREWQQSRKTEMIVAYGGRCTCCGEAEPVFLTLDHVNGGGRQERIALGYAGSLKRLRDAGWPKDGFRLLCMNCQFGYMHGRTCPHQT